MERFFVTLAATLALISATGCADMTPEQRAALAGAVAGGLAVGAAVAASAPRYYAPPAPVYVAPLPTVTRCTRWGYSINCTTY